jgi:hypothetical protein
MPEKVQSALAEVKATARKLARQIAALEGLLEAPETSEALALAKAKPDVDWALFDRFWEEWPIKANKAQARKAWQKLAPDHELTGLIIVGVRRHKQGRRWQEGIIMHPATFLNQERWNDDVMLPPGAQAGPENNNELF